MLIRKLYKVEGAHIVRDCSSKRCSHSVHGHSAVIEVFFTSDKLDQGGMVLDFGLMKGTINDFLDSFDHSLSIWNREKEEFINKQTQWSDRYIIMPVNPSAENYALMFLYVADKILGATQLNNGESDDIKIHSVRVHETDTGYAEAFRSDLSMVNFTLDDIKISDQVQAEYKDPNMWQSLKAYYQNTAANLKPFKNPVPEHYVM